MHLSPLHRHTLDGVREVRRTWGPLLVCDHMTNSNSPSCYIGTRSHRQYLLPHLHGLIHHLTRLQSLNRHYGGETNEPLQTKQDVKKQMA